MGCGASSAALKYGVGDVQLRGGDETNIWELYQARLPFALRDPLAMERAQAQVLPTLAAKEAELRDQQRALAHELHRHEWRCWLQKRSKEGYAAGLGAVEAIGVLLAKPDEDIALADFTRVEKRRVRQRLHEATVAVASSGEHVKRQSMLRRRLAGLQFAREYVDKLVKANASEIHTMHDEAQHELATAEVTCDRLSPAIAASAGAKHRLLRAQGVLDFADLPENERLFTDEDRARFAQEAELCGSRLRAAKLQATRAKEARNKRNLARQMIAMIRAVGGAPPSEAKASAVKLEVDNEILEAEDELVLLRARRGVSRHALAQRELHAAAATLRELGLRKATLRKTDWSDTREHCAMLQGQLGETVAVVALYRGARQLKRRERRRLRAAQGATDLYDSLAYPLSKVAMVLHTDQIATREKVEALDAAIASKSAKMIEAKEVRERWEVARGGRAFAQAVARRQRLPYDEFVTFQFNVQKDIKKKSAFKKLKQIKRMQSVALAPKMPPLLRRLVVLRAADLPKSDRIGDSDPYVVVYWNDERIGQSPILNDNANPAWGFTVPLAIPRPEGGMVRVEIYDHDATDADDLLGQAEMELKPEGDDDDQLRIPETTLTLEDDANWGTRKIPVQGTVTLRVDDPTLDIVREVVVVAAAGLRKADLLGGSDPYAVVLWDGERVGATHHVANTQNPRWEIGIPVSIPPCGGTARVELYDHDDGIGDADDFLGQVEVKLGGRGLKAEPLELKQKPYMLTTGPAAGGSEGKKVKGKLTVLVEDPSKQPPPVKRRLVIEKAQYLVNADIMGKSDPYVKAYWNGQMLGKTGTVEDSLDPVFPEAENGFEVMVPGGRGGNLRLEVFDDDAGPNSDDLLGMVELRLGGDKGLGGNNVIHNDKAEAFEMFTRKGKPAMGPRGRSKIFIRVEHPWLKRRLVIEKALELPEMDAGSACDPYARVYWNSALLGRTQVVKRTLEPVWDKEMMIGVPERGAKLKIVVLDRDLTSKDDVVGEIEMDIGGGAIAAGGAGVLLRSANYDLGPPGKPEKGPTSDGLYGKLRFRVEEPGVKRRLTVSRAAALRNADRGGTSDPFAIVTFAGEVLGKTGVIPDTVDPQWNHSWEVMVPPAGADLEIEIFDFDDNSKDDFLGYYKQFIGGDSVEEGGHNEALIAYGWHDLTTKKGKPVDGRVEFAFEVISQPVKDITAIDEVPEETGPVQVGVQIVGSEWDCWARRTKSFEDEEVDRGNKKPIVQLGLKVDSATWEIEVDLSVVVEAYHIEDRSIEIELECRLKREKVHEELYEWKEMRREANRLRGRLYALGRLEDALRERILAVPRKDLLDALFASIDADGDGDLTRIEVRTAPFGDTLSKYWIDLDKDHGESVDPDEFAQFFEQFEVKEGWTAANDLICSLVWDAQIHSTQRLQAGLAAAEHKAKIATAAAKEDAKAAAKAYFAGEEEKQARYAARGAEDAESPESEAWMAKMAERDELLEKAEAMKVASELAAAEQVEAEAEVAAMERVQELLSPILSASLEGESPDKEWEKKLQQLSRQNEKEFENCEEQLEALAPSLRLFNEAEATVLHIRGALEALNILSGGGGNPVRVKRQELKVDASLATLGVHASRSSRAAVSAMTTRLAVVEPARHLLGRLLRVHRLYYVDDMERRMKAAIDEEAIAAEAVQELAQGKDGTTGALDYRRDAKREAQRSAGAAAWTADDANRFFVEDSLRVKAAQVAAADVDTYNDARKWSVGSRHAKQRAAAAREQLRVLERFQDKQPDTDAARAMVAELAHDARLWTRDIALLKDIGAPEYDFWTKRLNAREGTLMVLSKAFMEKAEAEMQLRAAAERRLRDEAEALARDGGEARLQRMKEEKIIQDAEDRLMRIANEKVLQPRRRLEVGCECKLKKGARETGCLKQHQLGRVEIYERSSNRVKVRHGDNEKLSWYSCDTEVEFCGPRPESDLVELRANMERELAGLRKEAEIRAERAAFGRKQAEKLRAYDAEMEQGARMQAEADARASARKQVTTQVRTQLSAVLEVCGEKVIAYDPSTERRAGILRQLATISGGLSGVQGIRTCWGRARYNIEDNDNTRMMAFFAAELLTMQEQAEATAEMIGRMGGGGIDECEEMCRRAYDDRDQCDGGLQFLIDCEKNQAEKYFTNGTTERMLLERKRWVGDEAHAAHERYAQRREAEMELLRQEGRATVVRRLRSLLGLGLGHPPLTKVIAEDGTEQLVPRRPPDDLGGMLGLERRPVTPPTPPHYTPRLGHGDRPGPKPPAEELRLPSQL
jgi:hypothetical protein